MSLSKKSVLTKFALTVLAAILFSLAHPGIVNSRGFSIFGFFTLIPLFYLTYNTKARHIWIYAFIYGVLDYLLFVYWFIKYAWFFLVFICFFYGLYNALTFVLLRNIFNLIEKAEKNTLEKNNSFVNRNIFSLLKILCSASVWILYEFIKDSGFIGLSYGLLGYTQWQNTLLLQTAAFGGVWFVSFYLALFAATAASVLYSLKQNTQNKFSKKKSICLLEAVKKNNFALIIYIALTVFAAVYGACKISEEKSIPVKEVKLIAVQNNCDPWLNGVKYYEKDINALKNLTDKALSQNPDAKLVVWPETAVVTPIMYNYKEKSDYERYQMIVKLLDYFNSKNCAFITGNQHSEKGNGVYSNDYNSALLFDSKKKNVVPPAPEVYRKIHLVPFTEYFPYGKIFPKIYEVLLNGDTHLWTPGTEPVVFETGGMRFSTPICFEDTFGNLTRKFFTQNENGPQIFVNISNDAWAHNAACQYQHLSMAAFRSAECRIPTVRSTASGVTCYLDSTGKLVQEADSFKQTWLSVNAQIKKDNKKSFYIKHGDWFPYFAIIIILLIVAVSLAGARKPCVARKEENEVK